MKLTKWIAGMLVIALLLCGCGASSSSMSAVDNGYKEMEYYEEAYEPGEVMKAAGTAQSLPENRKWVITMDITAETEDLTAAMEAVFSQTAQLGGYVESQNIRSGSRYSGYGVRWANLTLRIPANAVDEFVNVLSGVTNVVNNSRNVKDITLTYTATESRITALQTEETRLLELMAQAESMSDLLEIESRLTDVRYELENYTSQLRRFDNQVDYATVDLSLEQVEEYTPAEKPGFFQRIAEGFPRSVKNLTEGIVDFIAWFIIDLPYLLLWAAVIGAVVFAAKKWKLPRRKKKAPKQDKTE